MTYDLELTDDQAEKIARRWIAMQQQETDGYKVVLDTLLMGAHFAQWSWLDALRYAVKKCGRAYAFDREAIINDLR